MICIVAYARQRNTTADNLAHAFTYEGAWTHLDASGLAGSTANATVADQYTKSENSFFNGSASISTEQGASVSLAFEGALPANRCISLTLTSMS